MCGIFYVKSKNMTNAHRTGWNGILEAFHETKSRGPDRSELRHFEDQVFGFHRLAINGLDKRGDQPFCLISNKNHRVSLIINGEIYNHRELAKQYNLPHTTGSDCEVFLHLYHKFGLANCINLLDGVFAFVLVDGEDVYVGRDAVGVRPVYYRRRGEELAVSSTPLGLEGFRNNFTPTKQVARGSYIHFNGKHADLISWYHLPRHTTTDEHIKIKIKDTLITAVKKRLLSQRPIGCLLSGGLDSSLIASILSKEMKKRNMKLKTFSIGFSPNATDLIAARKVAEFLGTDHQEIVVSPQEAFESINEVIKELGSYDITTVRASVGMYLICKWISKNTDIKVLFSGEGADELFCGYLYFHHAPSSEALEKESRRLVNELQFFDVLRSDRTVSCHGLELRVPFLDKKVIELALQIPGEDRHPKNTMEKFLLRSAFDDGTYIPSEILWRRKEGFSDGVGSKEDPWYRQVQEYTEDIISDHEVSIARLDNLAEPVTKESVYYYKIYHDYYQNTVTPIPHQWMPKWMETNDPSGRVVAVPGEVKE
jgi:asparagine synthase (glutamine-hydrolysing)